MWLITQESPSGGSEIIAQQKHSPLSSGKSKKHRQSLGVIQKIRVKFMDISRPLPPLRVILCYFPIPLLVKYVLNSCPMPVIPNRGAAAHKGALRRC